ncbi:RNA-binding protein 39 [Kwoniella heveanensis CBS 569]|nr:RNA-binding protein 39 [Kwoniella heveanensis CBS 569]
MIVTVRAGPIDDEIERSAAPNAASETATEIEITTVSDVTDDIEKTRPRRNDEKDIVEGMRRPRKRGGSDIVDGTKRQRKKGRNVEDDEGRGNVSVSVIKSEGVFLRIVNENVNVIMGANQGEIANSTHRDRSRESHRSSSHRPRDDAGIPSIKEMSREEKEAERERRDREMAIEKREAARLREERFAEMDRERERERRSYGRSPRDYSPPRRRRGSPMYDAPPPRDRDRERARSRDPATALLDEVDSESRSILVTQLSAKMTSQDLGMFFEDKLGRGAIRDARVVMDKVSRRSKGIGYVELDAVELVSRAVALSGTLVMGLPISIMPSEAERNRDGPVQSAPDAAIPYHRLYISNIAFSLSADDLRQVFEPFGELEFVDLHVDFSGMRKGTAYVQFKTLASAQMALDAMANFELAGRPIRVQTVQERAYVANEQIEDNGNYGTRLDATQRQQLMFKLARTEPTVNLALSKSPAMNPTTFLVVNNMFNPDEETERNWDLDLAEDVKTEVETKYGKVKRIKVDKMSAGEVYIEFDNLNGAGTALRGLNGRFFGGRQLQASYISETLFKAHL